MAAKDSSSSSEWSDVCEEEEDERGGDVAHQDDVGVGRLQIDLQGLVGGRKRRQRRASTSTAASTSGGSKRGVAFKAGKLKKRAKLRRPRPHSCKEAANKTRNASVSSASGVSNSGGGGGKKRRRRIRTRDVQVPKEVASLDTASFEETLEGHAKKKGLSRTQVKSVLRQLAEAPEMIKYVLARAGEGDEEGAQGKAGDVESGVDVEPKYTRTTAKQCKEAGKSLPWVLEKLNSRAEKVGSTSGGASGARPGRPRKRKVKVTRKVVDEDGREVEVEEETVVEEVPFVSADLPDDEEDDDAEFDPSAVAAGDAEDEEDNESAATSSVAGSAITPSRNDDTNDSLVTPSVSDAGDVFKHPSSSKPKRAMGTAQERAQASRSLRFDDGDLNIALSTRSKAPLRDTTIEELETQFVPPDLFEFDDLFASDNLDVDYVNFCRDTYYKPITETETNMGVSGAQSSEASNVGLQHAGGDGGGVNMNSAAAVDENEDPDFMFGEDELDELAHDESEYKFAKNTKVPKKELDYLINDAIEAFELDKEPWSGRKRVSRRERLLNNYKKRHDELHTPPPHDAALPDSHVRTNAETVAIDPPDSPRSALARAESSCDSYLLSHEQSSALSWQMSQHIQLLTQTTLLTGALASEMDEMRNLNTQCKEMAAELVGQTFEKNFSHFAQPNLMPSLQFVDEWERSGIAAVDRPKLSKCKERRRFALSNNFMKSVAESKNCFPFPSLLPTYGLMADVPSSSRSKVSWVPSEDAIIALQLELYFKTRVKATNSMGPGDMKRASEFMAGRLVKAKVPYQIYKRMKNQKLRRSKEEESNAICQFFKEGQAPRFRLDYPNFLSMTPPDLAVKDCDPDALPDNWRSFLNLPVHGANAKKKKKQDKKDAAQQQAAAAAPEPSLPVPQFSAVFNFNPQSGVLVKQEQQQQQLEKPREMPSLDIGVEVAADHGEKETSPDKGNSKKAKNKKSQNAPPVPILPKEVPVQISIVEATDEPKPSSQFRDILPKPPAGEETAEQEQMDVDGDPTSRIDGSQEVLDGVAQQGTEPKLNLLSQALEDCGFYGQLITIESPNKNRDKESNSSGDSDGKNAEDATNGDEGGAVDEAPVQVDEAEGDGDEGKEGAAAVASPPKKARKDSSASVGDEDDEETEVAATRNDIDEDVEDEEEDEDRESDARLIINYAKRELKDAEFCRFLELLVEHESDGAAGFCALSQLCQGHLELQEMLLDLLSPEEAADLGIYAQFAARKRHKRFFRRLREEYQGHPLAINRVYKEIGAALLDPDYSSSSLESLAARLFKGHNQHLHDAFLALIPGNQLFPASQLPPPEVINFEDLVEQNENGDDEDGGGAIKPEVIALEAGDAEHEFGGENCPCRCHVCVTADSKVEDGTHCMHCSLAFINGRTYLRDGKTLRPVKAEFPKNKASNVKGKSKGGSAAPSSSIGKSSNKRKGSPSTTAVSVSAAAAGPSEQKQAATTES